MILRIRFLEKWKTGGTDIPVEDMFPEVARAKGNKVGGLFSARDSARA